MKYAYHDLSADQFEELIVCVCQRLLGISVKGFAPGRDGGRDAKFEGTAEMHPSRTSPWIGKVIIQAKHTNGFNKSFSETDFYSKSTSSHVIGKEVPRIKSLRKKGDLDHYMLFSNRRMTAGADDEIQKHISKSCSIPTASVYLCGVEQLEALLKRFADIAPSLDLNPLDSPLIVTSDELAEVVEAFGRNKDALIGVTDAAPMERVSFAAKNEENNMTAKYATFQRKLYLKDTADIKAFLEAPENEDLAVMYQNAADEFEAKIIARRREFDTFDNVMEYLISLLYERDAVLRQRNNRRLTRAMIFYMYFNCDIGRVNVAAPN